MKIHVNKIYDENGVTHGLSVLEETIIENLLMVFPDLVQGITATIKSNPAQDFYFINKFCQLVVLYKYDRNGQTLHFMDFNNSTDTALDEHLELQKAEWMEDDMNKIMQLVSEIQNSPNGQAELIELNPFPSPL